MTKKILSFLLPNLGLDVIRPEEKICCPKVDNKGNYVGEPFIPLDFSRAVFE
jgi:hypothetical protein